MIDLTKKQIESRLKTNGAKDPVIRRLCKQLLSTLKLIDGKQAKIDSLMLEYCPDEMTEEQVTEWGRHQTPAEPITG